MISSVHPSSSSSSSFTVRELCLAAVMAAVVFLATFVPRIPIPLGYAHLGDAENAADACRNAVERSPQEERLRKNLALFEQMRER